MTSQSVTYEAFGAIGDGVADDLPAVVAAHAHANATGRSVRSNPEAIYNLGSQGLTAVIQTDTDWSTSRFIINDREADPDVREQPVFRVTDTNDPVDLALTTLTSGQARIDNHQADTDWFVSVEQRDLFRYRRRGLNVNDGFPQCDSFILRHDGDIDGDINWDYSAITSVTARQISSHTLVLRGGVFTTIANAMHREQGYHYWQRNLMIMRSNTEVVGLTHYVAEETARGCPYGGFIAVAGCADITLRDCFFTGRRVYETLGSAGQPVRMGSYDVTVRDAVNFHMRGCSMHHINDRTLWGVVETNFCKNILIEDCVLSRVDTHMGVAGNYTVRRSHLGYMGLKAIGRGQLTLADSTIEGPYLIEFRPDFGATWDGDVEITNTHWIPDGGSGIQPYLFHTVNDGQHDFGYPCCMPRSVTINGLTIDDRRHPSDYRGPCVFADAGDEDDSDATAPYTLCQQVSVANLSVSSGLPLRLSDTQRLVRSITLLTDAGASG